MSTVIAEQASADATLVRSIGRWSLAALVLNSIVGSGIFGLPSELVSLLGRASPVAMLVAGAGTAVILACFAEVASKFSSSGGPYLYCRTAFGRFVGLQVIWFALLARMGSAAANATLLVAYLAGLWPAVGDGAGRATALTVVIGGTTLANCIGVRVGAGVSNVVAVAKLLPLVVIIAAGIYMFPPDAGTITAADLVAPGAGSWFSAFLLLSFAYGGFEAALIPMAEVQNPRRSAPFALAVGLLVAVLIYTLLQLVVVLTLGTAAPERPLAAVASRLFGASGLLLMTIAAIVSTYGTLNLTILTAPRLTFSLATHGEFPAVFGRVHPRFRTPHVSLLVFGALVLAVAVTGTFRWAVALSAAARLITYASTSAALLPLRRILPDAGAFRVPVAPLTSGLAVVLCLALVTRVRASEGWLLLITGLVAMAHWLIVRRKTPAQSAAGHAA